MSAEMKNFEEAVLVAYTPCLWISSMLTVLGRHHFMMSVAHWFRCFLCSQCAFLIWKLLYWIHIVGSFKLHTLLMRKYSYWVTICIDLTLLHHACNWGIHVPSSVWVSNTLRKVTCDDLASELIFKPAFVFLPSIIVISSLNWVRLLTAKEGSNLTA